ncbi:MAG: ABC transporter ATP-binding protein [Anaerolineales bacterium]|nr:ABC transporter ATP-binding protein [Anaerolineales bacterium]
MKTLLHVDNISAGYGALTILRDVSLVVKPGQIVCVLGSNGAGKSTLVRAITGLARTVKGDIHWEGNSILGLQPYEVAALGIALVPEDRLLFTSLSAHDNLMVGSAPLRSEVAIKRNLDLVHSIFPRLSQREQQLAGTLSGGEQQMLTIGRALMSSPKLLILDEPTIGIAPHLVHEIFEAIKQLSRDLDISVLIVEQHADQALALSEYAYVIDQGVVVMSGSSDQLARDPRVREAYLGID